VIQLQPIIQPPTHRQPRNVILSDTEWQQAKDIGHGNGSAGIRHLLQLYNQLLQETKQ
jgi:hypothetical protein